MPQIDILVQLVLICGEYFVYHASLALLAWATERQTGSDAFHMVASFTAGVLFSVATYQYLTLPLLPALIVGGAVASAIDSTAAAFLVQSRRSALFEMLIVATVSLTLFDWVTASSPVSLPLSDRVVANVLLLAGAAACLLVWMQIRHFPNRGLSLGKGNLWAIDYWLPSVSYRRSVPHIVRILAWTSAIGIATTVTGVLSFSVLKDVTMAVLIGRLASTRGLPPLLGAAATLAVLKPLAGFVIEGNAGPPVIEGMLFVVAVFWVRQRGARTPWREVLDR